jgi:hypothetical protein
MVSGVCCAPVLVATLAVLAVAAHAQNRPPIKPGLWEVKQTREMNGEKAPDMSEHLAKLPPEVRKQMEAQMKERGVQMGTGGATKVCLSAENLSREDWASGQSSCQTEILSRSAAAWKWRSSCPQPPSTAEGETRFKGDSAYTTVVDMTMQRQGQAQKMHMEMDGKWLAADCGDLKPVTPFKMPAAGGTGK